VGCAGFSGSEAGKIVPSGVVDRDAGGAYTTVMPRIDVNADLGEGYPTDSDILPWISSANIAAGGHAGGGDTLLHTVELAAARSIAVGAHISYPDRDNFGRTSQPDIDAGVLVSALSRQLEDVLAAADIHGVPVTHVKPHGALYNDAARDQRLADLLCQVLHDHAPAGVLLYGLAGSLLQSTAADAGVVFVAEGFADRTYQPDGHLRSRLLPGAVHEEEGVITRQAHALATGEPFPVFGGVRLTIPVDSICVHGDTPEAVRNARRIHETLTSAGVHITPPTPATENNTKERDSDGSAQRENP